MSDFSHIEVRKARAKHGCVDCHGVIQKGERYAVYSGACEGNMYAEKVCSPCAKLRKQGMTFRIYDIPQIVGVLIDAPTEAQKEQRCNRNGW